MELTDSKNFGKIYYGTLIEQFEKYLGFEKSKFTEVQLTIFPQLYQTKNTSEDVLEGIKKAIAYLTKEGFSFTFEGFLEYLQLKEDFDCVGKERKKKYLAAARLEEIENLIKSKETAKEGFYKLAEYIVSEFNVRTFDDTDETYIYSEGVYVLGTKKILKHIQNTLDFGKFLGIHQVNELLGHIRRMTYTSRDKLVEPADKLCLANGILCLETLQVLPHSPDVIFFSKLPVAYYPLADCPKIKSFFAQIVPSDAVPLLEEIAGFCLYKRYFIHISIMLVGAGANGKSTFINLLRMLLGKENCTSIPLQKLEMNNFAVSSLFGKLANVFADLPSRALKETSFFKMLTGEDLVTAEKKFRDQFFFVNYGKLIFSCNQIPRSPDESDGFFRRWLIINFPNQFTENAADPKLLEKLTSQDELSGFLNIAITGLQRLLKNGNFTGAQSISAVREDYVRKSDSIAAFTMDCLELSSESYISKKELYTSYADYCRSRNYPISPENSFHRSLPSKLRVEDYRPSLDVEGKNQRVSCWRGIKCSFNREKNLDNPDNVDREDEKHQLSVNHVKDVKAEKYIKEQKVLGRQLAFQPTEKTFLPCTWCNEHLGCDFIAEGKLYCKECKIVLAQEVIL